MTDAVELTDDAFTEDTGGPPGFRSDAGRTTLFTVVFCTAFPLLFLQFVVPYFLAIMIVPAGTPTLFNLRIEAAGPAQSIWWQGRLWVMTTSTVPGSAPVIALRAIDDKGQWDRTSDINLPVPFESAVVDGDRLFLVASTAVTTIENRQTRTTYPRLKLNQPSRPFIKDGQLCVLDHPTGVADVVWYEYREGEWAERGRIAMPAEYQAAFAARPATAVTRRTVRTPMGGPFGMPIIVPAGQTDVPLVTVLPDSRVWVAVPMIDDSTRLFTTIDPPLTSSASVANADAPADAMQLDDPVNIVQWTEHASVHQPDASAATFQQESVLIGSSHLGTGINASRLQVLALRDQGFASIHDFAGFSAEHSAPIPKPDGTLLFVGRTLVSPMGLQVIELTPAGFGSLRRMGDSGTMDTSKPSFWPIWLLMTFWPTLTATVLGLVAHVMVEKHRDRRFSFGHRTVKMASLARRGTARVIDMYLFTAPITFGFSGFWLTGDFIGYIEQQFSNAAFSTLLLWGLSLALGAMLYIVAAVLFFGTLEGVWGLSPGKWLLGLRVIRTTFRPIGFFRGLIRQFLLMIDGQPCYFVAILMVTCLSKMQRLGDLCADSIVVERRSLPTHWRKPPVTPAA